MLLARGDVPLGDRVVVAGGEQALPIGREGRRLDAESGPVPHQFLGLLPASRRRLPAPQQALSAGVSAEGQALVRRERRCGDAVPMPFQDLQLLASIRIPHLRRILVAGRQQPARLPRQRQDTVPADAFQTARRGEGHLSAGRAVPLQNRAVKGSGEHLLAVRKEDRSHGQVFVPFGQHGRTAVLQIPQPGRVIAAGGDRLASVRREGRAEHGIRVPRQRAELLRSAPSPST